MWVRRPERARRTGKRVQVNGHAGESEGVPQSRERPRVVFLHIFTTVLWAIQEEESFQRTML